MELQPHQKRVVDEENELDVKIAALAGFLKADRFRDLGAAEQQRLRHQHVVMVEYSAILSARVAAFSSNADYSMVGMSFGAAVQSLKMGMKATRAGWNGKGMWIALGSAHPGLEAEKFWNPHARKYAELNGGTCPVQQYFLMKTAQGDIQMGWSPTGSDALAEDWLIVH